MKIFKAGKSYIVRASVPLSNGQASLKIYDEDENDVKIESIKENTQVMIILEIQGIRCSSSSFQIDIELKQMMVMKPEDLFNQFIFKKKSQEIKDLGKSEEVQIKNDKPIEEDKEDEEDKDEPAISIETPMTELCEVEFDLDKLPIEDTVPIKDRKEMYYEMYREARQKAKVARDLALSAYLEAKRIKNTYLLTDANHSDDSDLEDNELDFQEEPK